ncbi:MAG TPA: DNA polymerase I [Terriglobales bacterium]|nr:DNA polymerase I [Terriglobales bacterium]
MKLLLFDGNSVLNRAFYGVRTLTTSEGLFTNGIYGFLSIYYKELEAEKPDAACVAFDLKEKTFRHEKYGEYKAGRRPMPEELAMQVPLLKETLDAMRVPRREIAGYEADDIIGTLAKCWPGEVVIITGDKDELQLVSDRVTVKLAVTKGGQSDTARYTPETVGEVYGFAPPRIVDMKALMGDPSDNIPGVAGVGEKTALALLHEHGSLDGVYAALDKVKPTVRKKLEEGKEAAYMSYELATICTGVPVPDADKLALLPPDEEKLAEMFRKLEFTAFAKRVLTPKKAQVAPVTALSDLSAAASGLALAGDTFATEKGVFGFDEKQREKILAVPDKSVWQGKGISGVGFDAELAAYLINPSAASSPEALCAAYLGRELVSPAADLFELRPLMEARLEADGLTVLLKEVELPLSAVLADMERVGFLVDAAALKEFGQELHRRAAGIEDKIRALAGDFNINSPKQLGEVLFERLGLPHGKRTKTGYATDADTLANIAPLHPVVGMVLEYRKLAKLTSTYVDGLLALVGPDGRIHTTFKQTATVTGRLSSAEPNLQNIPVREELGRELRRMFVAPAGSLLLDADYSQIELRVLAHIANDPVMTETFKAGGDIHAETARRVFGSDAPEWRRRAKAVNFGIVYGISDFSLAGDIGVTRAEARRFIDGYFTVYSGVKKYLDGCVAKAKTDGYVTTMFGRRRYLPELQSANFNQRSFGERAAMNTPIQGTAADIIKIAMVRVAKRLAEEGLQSKLILQVHDELIVEAPEAEAGTAARILEYELSHAAELSVPLTAEVHAGRSWYDAK